MTNNHHYEEEEPIDVQHLQDTEVDSITIDERLEALAIFRVDSDRTEANIVDEVWEPAKTSDKPYYHHREEDWY